MGGKVVVPAFESPKLTAAASPRRRDAHVLVARTDAIGETATAIDERTTISTGDGPRRFFPNSLGSAAIARALATPDGGSGLVEPAADFTMRASSPSH